MTDPKGTLTGPQFEILQILWESDRHAETGETIGMSVVEIWNEVQKQRSVSRTTILNLVDRLEKRGWLAREKSGGVFRYKAMVEQQSTEHKLADEFIGDFFGGSTGNFLLSLLGSQHISKAEVERLKKMLDEKTSTRKGKKKGSK